MKLFEKIWIFSKKYEFFQKNNENIEKKQQSWLEYKEKATKELVIFDLLESKSVYKENFDKNTEFISHGKLFHKWMIFVKDNKNVMLVNYSAKETKNIYSHKSTIMALDMLYLEEEQILNEKIENIEKNNDNIILQIDEPQQENKKNMFILDNDNVKLKNLAIFSIDYNGNLMVFRNGLIIHNFNVLR